MPQAIGLPARGGDQVLGKHRVTLGCNNPLVLPKRPGAAAEAVAGCDSNTSTGPLNDSITGALQRGMTEQQVAEVSNNRVLDRVVMKTCGTETADAIRLQGLRLRGGAAGRSVRLEAYGRLEDIRGQWIVTQWL